MFILPVLDLLNNRVVRGIGGRRSEYRPIESQLFSEPRPGIAAQALATQFGFHRAYVADLNAIQGEAIQREAYREIATSLPELWIDAGIASTARLAAFQAAVSELPVEPRLIIGLESIVSIAEFAELYRVCDPARTVVSLDLKAGCPLLTIPEWIERSPFELVQLFSEFGVQTMILLDLADVGAYEGTSTLRLLEQCKSTFPHIAFLTGGGVRSDDDLLRLESAGCSGALVASALHDGRLSRSTVARYLE